MNPIFPDAQPYDNIMWIAIAVIVVWLNRKTMFSREAGVTNILIEESTPIEQPDSAYSLV
jgi:hypothetical protein